MAVRGEVQTTQMVRDTLERGKRVAVPFIETTTRTLRISIVEDVDRDLGPGHFGILEPYVEAIREVSPTLIELVILPGVAFDTAGGRLGRGGGYYDRLLATLSPAVPKIGLAFALQIIPCVPTLPYDIPIDILVTEEGVVCCQKVRARENTDSLSKG
jgi:5-formyltetrahydrofolate cyclo-ligase